MFQQNTAAGAAMRVSLRIAIIYAVSASLWILLSDQVLLLTVSDESVTQLQTYKGIVFVIITSLLLYIFLEHESNRRDETEQEVRTLAQRLEERVAQRTQELEQVNKYLQEVNRLRLQLIGNVSHDLRTPITSLTLRMELLERTALPEQTRHIVLLKNYITNLKDLVEDIFDISYLEDIQAAELNERSDFNLLIERAITVNQPFADTTNVTVQAHFDKNLPSVIGTSTHLDRVVTNLVNNAVKYSPGATVDIYTHYMTEEKMVQFTVTDTGMGIPQEEHKQLFSRFYRGKTARKSGIAGTGLGLAIVKEVVDLHRGRIEFESQVGKGTTVKVLFPVQDQTEI